MERQYQIDSRGTDICGECFMILVAHQPNYLPYIGFFHKVMQCDVFVLADHVQYEKKGWQNRNKIRTKNGWTWLTVPVLTKNNFEQRINKVRINNAVNWQIRHWRSIYYSYKKAPFFNLYKDFFEELYTKRWERLVDLNETIIMFLLQELNIKAEVIKSSNLNLRGKKTDLLIEMCKKLNADTYFSGVGGKAYIEERKFKEQNLNLLYQDFRHPVYRQRHKPFIPYLSVIDLMFNRGSNHSSEIIRNSGGVVPVQL